jgi:putative Ca2+/H+ antiporter (TMEM165/GDT1 family)/uncharacterized membrane protein (UPF0127 family)
MQLAFIVSFIFVLLAEMADKTQLLAMAFAARYPAGKVLFAVFLATLLNHSLAVWAGHILTLVIPIDIISFVAALSFVIFGLWTIRKDKLAGQDKKHSRFGPVITVGIAFFLAEMGDKTQLATISLAVKYDNMLGVLMGTTLAMVCADAIGIVAGVIMRRHIPENAIKLFSAGIFIVFGFTGMYKVLSGRFSPAYVFLFLLFVGACTIYGWYYLARKPAGFAKSAKPLFLSLLILCLTFACARAADAQEPLPKKARIYINATPIDVEFACTLLERQKGLSFRDNLCKACGMLFVFAEPGIHGFYMKDTLIDLDIAFIDRALRIFEIFHLVRGSTDVFYPRRDAAYALEVNRGFFTQHNIKTGDYIVFP